MKKGFDERAEKASPNIFSRVFGRVSSGRSEEIPQNNSNASADPIPSVCELVGENLVVSQGPVLSSRAQLNNTWDMGSGSTLTGERDLYFPQL